MNILRRIRRWWRSSITGRFVSRSFAEQNPSTTIEQKKELNRED